MTPEEKSARNRKYYLKKRKDAAWRKRHNEQCAAYRARTRKPTRIEEARREAYEQAAKVVEQRSYLAGFFSQGDMQLVPNSVIDDAAAAIRRLSSKGDCGPEHVRHLIISQIRAAVLAEREACAKVAEDEPEPDGDMPAEIHAVPLEAALRGTVRATAKSIAAAIRARGTGE